MKGIFKDVVGSVVDIIKDFKRIECPSQSIDIHKFGASSNMEESLENLKAVQGSKALLWKLAEYKREQMLNLLEKNKPTEKGKEIKRPIFDNLFMMQFKNDPEKW